MTREPDYQKAYEILDEALGDAIHILQKARLRTTLSMRLDSGELTADDEGDSAELYVKTAQEYADHCT
ncbi:hypothetical protein JQM66_02940 [Oscillibacter valericigenes]|uniref:hypothetical protein n=1 Tax=Oscillibacter valericigenes TaxID=351091 RepID=UPI001F37CD2F|nr:hypothetical protein [Oscillibacter valericigenes]MCF2663508.1 hypothetical protein [Oscillibacter valericigenes]